jgi:GWxTD domain-containing protein
MKVVDSAGKTLTTTAGTPVTVPAGGGVLKGQLDLNGLPPGHYTMAASLQIGGQAVERSAAFTMAGLDETLEKDVARREADKDSDEGYFEAMDEKQLNAAKEPLILVAESGSCRSTEGPERSRQAAVPGRVLAKRDRTPATRTTRSGSGSATRWRTRTGPTGEKGRAAVPGWKTDRGRIYVRNGAPESAGAAAGAPRRTKSGGFGAGKTAITSSWIGPTGWATTS